MKCSKTIRVITGLLLAVALGSIASAQDVAQESADQPKPKTDAQVWQQRVWSVPYDTPVYPSWSAPYQIPTANAPSGWMYAPGADYPIFDYRTLATGDQSAVSKYWIGVQCAPAGEVPIQSDSKLGDLIYKGGLKVQAITPKSPAQEAGLRVGDVLVSADGKKLSTIKDLLTAVGKAEEASVQMVIVRDKKQQSVKVTPKKRPENPNLRQWNAAQDVWQTLDTPWSMRWSDTLLGGRPLPKDLEITIHRKGSAPPTIEVKKGDSSWKVTAREINKLPAEVRPYVQQMIGGSWRPSLVTDNTARVWRATPNVVTAWDERRTTQNNMQKKLDRMAEQLKRLQKSVDELKADR